MSENNNSIGMNELVDYKKKEYGKFRGWIMHFLWKCAGADSQILKYAPFYDHIKYAGIGGIVFATGLLAFISMSFAISYIFETLWASLLIGAVWGLIIFNLDRFLISATGKGDGKETISLSEIWPAGVIRIMMAVILGITISAPLEVYIFRVEIDKEFFKQNEIEKRIEIRKIENIDKSSPEFIKLNSDKELFEKEIDQVRNSKRKVEDLRDAENTTAKGGKGGKWITFNEEVIKKEQEIKEVQIKLTDIDNKLDIYKIKKDKKVKELNDTNKKRHGLLDRILTLEKIPGATLPALLIRLMFIIIEVAPILFKMMLVKSSYDWMQDNVAQILEAKQGISLESFPDENNNAHNIRRNYNAERIIEVSKRQNDLEKENAIHAITLYAEQERKEIEDNPEDFVKNKDHDAKPTESNEPENKV